MRVIYNVVLALMLMSTSTVALCCSCHTTAQSLDEEVSMALKSAAAVVSAEVINVKVYPSEFDGERVEKQRATWRVRKTWKGPHLRGQTMVSETIATCCLCGLRVKKGQRLLLFVYGSKPYSISSCSSSGLVSESREKIALLDKLMAPIAAVEKE